MKASCKPPLQRKIFLPRLKIEDLHGDYVPPALRAIPSKHKEIPKRCYKEAGMVGHQQVDCHLVVADYFAEIFHPPSRSKLPKSK